MVAQPGGVPRGAAGSVLPLEGEVSPLLAPSRDGANRDEDLPPLKNFQQGDFLYLDLRSGK